MSGPGGPRPPGPAPEAPARLSPDQPVWEVDGDQRVAEEGHTGEQPRALVPDTVRPAGITVSPSSRPAVSPRPVRSPQAPGPRLALGRGSAGSGPSGWGRRLLAAVLAVGLFAGGIVVGSVLAGGRGEPARPASAVATSAAPTSAPPTTTAPAREVVPPACLSAVDDADAVISYLVANLRDQRLAGALQQYRAASSACRRAR